MDPVTPPLKQLRMVAAVVPAQLFGQGGAFFFGAMVSRGQAEGQAGNRDVLAESDDDLRLPLEDSPAAADQATTLLAQLQHMPTDKSVFLWPQPIEHTAAQNLGVRFLGQG